MTTEATAATPAGGACPLPDADRVLVCGLSRAEFGAVRWAANRAGPPGARAQRLADFYRAAVIARVRAIARAESAAGRPVPENILEIVKGEL